MLCPLGVLSVGCLPLLYVAYQWRSPLKQMLFPLLLSRCSVHLEKTISWGRCFGKANCRKELLFVLGCTFEHRWTC